MSSEESRKRIRTWTRRSKNWSAIWITKSDQMSPSIEQMLTSHMKSSNSLSRYRNRQKTSHDKKLDCRTSWTRKPESSINTSPRYNPLRPIAEKRLSVKNLSSDHYKMIRLKSWNNRLNGIKSCRINVKPTSRISLHSWKRSWRRMTRESQLWRCCATIVTWPSRNSPNRYLRWKIQSRHWNRLKLGSMRQWRGSASFSLRHSETSQPSSQRQFSWQSCNLIIWEPLRLASKPSSTTTSSIGQSPSRIASTNSNKRLRNSTPRFL